MNINIRVSSSPVDQPTLTKAQQKNIVELLDQYVGYGLGKYQTGFLTGAFGVSHWKRIPAVKYMDCIRLIQQRYKNRPKAPTHTADDLAVYKDFKKEVEKSNTGSVPDDVAIIAELLRTIKMQIDNAEKQRKTIKQLKSLLTSSF